MADQREKYYTHLILDPVKTLEEVAKKLKESKDVRIKKYFKDGNLEEVKLHTRFLTISIEDHLLRGTVKFETPEEIIDIDDNLVIQPKAHVIKFFISLRPRPHLII